MKKYEVVVTDRAAIQLNIAADWIAERAPDAAAKWFNRAVERIASLSLSPERCGKAHESKRMPLVVRELLLGPKRTWRVLFTVRESTVTVMAIRHASQVDVSVDDLLDLEE